MIKQKTNLKHVVKRCSSFNVFKLNECYVSENNVNKKLLM